MSVFRDPADDERAQALEVMGDGGWNAPCTEEAA
jgi:hypothetical protein